MYRVSALTLEDHLHRVEMAEARVKAYENLPDGNYYKVKATEKYEIAMRHLARYLAKKH